MRTVLRPARKVSVDAIFEIRQTLSATASMGQLLRIGSYNKGLCMTVVVYATVCSNVRMFDYDDG
jgi:hypothetical protein